MPLTMTAEREAELDKFSTRGIPVWPGGSLAALQEQKRELDAERASHQETQAKLDEMERTRESWVDQVDADREAVIRRKTAETQAIVRELLEALGPFINGEPWRYLSCHAGAPIEGCSLCGRYYTALAIHTKAKGVLPA